MPRRLVPCLVVAAFALLAACGGGDGPAVPTGEPMDIVRNAAERTRLAGRAQVFADGPDGRHVEGTVDLATGKGSLSLRGPELEAANTQATAGTIPPAGALPDSYRRIEYLDPAATVDLVRHVETVDPFGGLTVRGAGVIRYDITIRPPGEDPFFADAYVDAKGRLRRLTVAEDRKDHRVNDREYRLARLITIDIVFAT